MFEDYANRIVPALSLTEVEEKRPLDETRLKQCEGRLLLEQVPAGAVTIALDESGSELSSVALAGRITDWRDQGCASLCFLIGGANGHSPEVLERAQFRLSLGRMTWPHMLVRVMIAEQLYRAQQIAIGHPYHRK